MIRPHLALLLVTLIYGIFYTVIKLLITEMSPWETFSLRLLLSVPVLIVIELLFFRQPLPPPRELLKMTGLGILGITLVHVTLMEGIARTSVFHTGVIAGTAPIVTLLLSVVMRQERLHWHKMAGIALAFIGLYLLISRQESGTNGGIGSYLGGDILIFVNIALWSLYMILSRPILQRYNPFSLVTYTFTLAALVTLPFMFYGIKAFPGAGLSLKGWGLMGFVVLIGTVLTYFLNYYALSRLAASTVTVYVFLQPLVVTMFGYLLLHEPLTLPMILQGGMIVCGVALATGSHRPLLEKLSYRLRP